MTWVSENYGQNQQGPPDGWRGYWPESPEARDARLARIEATVLRIERLLESHTAQTMAQEPLSAEQQPQP